MRKPVVLPLLAGALGCVGLVLRRWAVTSGFEPDTGLAISGHPAFLALIVLSVASLLVLAVTCRGGRKFTQEECPVALSLVHPLPLMLSMAAAMLCLLSGAASLLDFLSVFQTSAYDSGFLACVTPLFMGALGLASGVALIILGRRRHQKGGPVAFSFLPLLPAFFACFWLIDVYRVRASDPVILDYAWFFLGAITLVLALYCSAGFAFRNGKPFMALFWSLSAVTFCLITLGDTHTVMEYLLLAAAVLWCLAQAYALLVNLEKPVLDAPAEPVVPSPEPPEEEDDDVDIVL